MVGKPQTNDLALLWSVGIVFGLMVLNKAIDFLNVWIRRPESQSVVLFLCVLILTPLFYWMTKKRASNLKRQTQEKAVIGKAEGSVYCGVTDKKEEVYIKPWQRAMHIESAFIISIIFIFTLNASQPSARKIERTVCKYPRKILSFHLDRPFGCNFQHKLGRLPHRLCTHWDEVPSFSP
jgi:hypothetical protein